MIRVALLGVLTLAFSAPAQDKKDVPKELAPFQGTWKVVKGEDRGQAFPPEFLDGMGFMFAGERVTINRKDPITKKDEPATGTFAVDAKKEPAEFAIDLQGAKLLGIYKIDKDGKLTIAYAKANRDAKPEDRPKKFDDKGVVMMVLEKVK